MEEASQGADLPMNFAVELRNLRLGPIKEISDGRNN
jgi:hypothetical protein